MDTPEPLDLGRWFDPVDLDTWRDLATKTLKGRDPDSLDRKVGGVTVRPLEHERPPGAVALARRGPWQIRQEVRGPGAKASARAIKVDVSRGADAPWIRLDRASRLGVRPDEARDEPSVAPGLSLMVAGDLAGLLSKLKLTTTPVVIEAGANGLAVLGALLAVAHQRGVPADALRGVVQADPMAALAGDGVLPRGVDAAYDDLAACVSFVREHAPGLRVVGVSTLPAAEAGADAVTELAIALASLATTLRRLEARGLSPARVLPATELVVGIGRDVLVETAKLRALRRLVARFAAACGAPGVRVPIHARQSDAWLATVDPWTNLLRSTQAGFVGAVGGADALTLLPHDAALGESPALSRRIARNLHLLLRDEAHLGRVEDPAAGSYTFESLTDRLCRAAWDKLQAIESGGGLLQALSDGTLAEELASQAGATEVAVSKRKLGLVGVSLFPDATEALKAPVLPDAEAHDHQLRSRWHAAQIALDEGPADANLNLSLDALRSGTPERVPPAANAASLGAHLATIAGAVPGMPFTGVKLVTHRIPSTWEDLRRRVEGAEPRPGVFLANLGPIPAHKAREDFARNLLAAGGLRIRTNEGFDDPDAAASAYGTSGCTGACICGSDDAYERLVPVLASQLRAAGAAFVVVAGRWPADPEPWKQAGVSHVVHLGAPVLDTLTDLAELALEAR